MEAVTVSSKYQIVIPKEIREAMGIKPGDKIRIFRYNGRLELVPVRDIRKMRGWLKGLDTTVEREEDRL
jgi:AbrB family looped-hinge helix DNA binding protein